MIDGTPIRFTVPGVPVGKGRARSFIHKRGGMAGRIGHHTPEKTRSYESLIAGLGMQAMGSRKPLTGPVCLRLVAVYAIPASWPHWKRQAALEGLVRPTVKPDRSNVEKAAEDALNCVCWVDDAQVVDASCRKVYGEIPRLEIEICVASGYSAQLVARSDVVDG